MIKIVGCFRWLLYIFFVPKIVKNRAQWFVLDLNIQLPGVVWANVNSPETAK
jgi:hypothetical protein